MDDYREVVCHETAVEWRKSQKRRHKQDDAAAWAEEKQRRGAEMSRANYGPDSRL